MDLHETCLNRSELCLLNCPCCEYSPNMDLVQGMVPVLADVIEDVKGMMPCKYCGVT